MIAAAADCLRGGGLVAFPTETVYGIGANAEDVTAVERLYRVKGRPEGKPLTVHLADAGIVPRMALDWTPAAQALTRQFWPGPLTVVVARLEGGTVGLRVPRHAVAHALLSAAGVPVVAPSANRSGATPPTTADDVERELAAGVDVLLDAGPTQMGEASTVVDCTVHPPRILRRGAMRREIEAALAAL